MTDIKVKAADIGFSIEKIGRALNAKYYFYKRAKTVVVMDDNGFVFECSARHAWKSCSNLSGNVATAQRDFKRLLDAGELLEILFEEEIAAGHRIDTPPNSSTAPVQPSVHEGEKEAVKNSREAFERLSHLGLYLPNIKFNENENRYEAVIDKQWFKNQAWFVSCAWWAWQHQQAVVDEQRDEIEYLKAERKREQEAAWATHNEQVRIMRELQDEIEKLKFNHRANDTLQMMRLAAKNEKLQKRVDALENKIKAHNSECESACSKHAGNNHCGYANYERNCPDCPKQRMIDQALGGSHESS